jgi:23S rRNA (uracil1939-C5)-methyltransferase
MKYEVELRAKYLVVSDAFLRIGGIECKPDNIIPSEKMDAYRNKAQIPVGVDAKGNPICGFYAGRSHRIIPSSHCKLHPPVFGKITDIIMGFVRQNKIPPYDENSGEGLLRNIYIRGAEATGEIMVCLVVTCADIPGIESLVKPLSKVDGVSSILLNINDRDTNVILGERNVHLWGSEYITDVLCGIKIRLSPHSFYQVNRAGAQKLYSRARELMALRGGEHIVDLYCGAGSIGLSILAASGDANMRLTGVEIAPKAVEDARANAEINGISNAEFICGSAETAAAKLANEGIRPDVVVIDPPRGGCASGVLDAIVKMSPARVVMISCNPATAARDCKHLSECGYEVRSITPVDMFPRTRHVECVVVLKRLAQ